MPEQARVKQDIIRDCIYEMEHLAHAEDFQALNFGISLSVSLPKTATRLPNVVENAPINVGQAQPAPGVST
jgi:hypothetical protein